jgi:hypothetical protein
VVSKKGSAVVSRDDSSVFQRRVLDGASSEAVGKRK